ncbi:MAG: flagellar assembly protein FliW [candidate division Zixibacteria bacterium]|nr:flagellar assembly protein FliW [candidate division Zixibacteria bacterium]MCK4607079.1 flagellar assembly protein FliW [candidate division Zixibacteria bacterium]
MRINSSRLGPIEVPDDKLITMERPILGFEGLTRFCLVERDEMAPFLWLQSAEEEAVAFIVVNPRVFFPDYRIEVNRKEIAELRIKQLESVETYVIVTMKNDPRDLSANLQGPILINTENGLAKQLVLVNSEYKVGHRILDAVERLDRTVEQKEELVGV